MGQCYFVEQEESPETKLPENFELDKFKEKYMMVDNVDVKTYYEDPVLTFEDSLIMGCSIELNLEEFKDFCKNSLH